MPSKAKILIVDDKRENLTAFAAAFEPLVAEVYTANSGDEALRQVLNHEFSVIVLDVFMPGLNGVETARMIRSRVRSRDVPILFITGFDHEYVHMQEAYSLGAVDYVQKPVAPEILRAKVNVFTQLYAARAEIQARARDLTEANQRLVAMRDELMGINRELEAFVRAASHDLRQPLNAIQGITELLTLSTSQALEDADRQKLAFISTSAARMRQTMDGLLALSRSGSADLECTHIDLASLARPIIETLELGDDAAERAVQWQIYTPLAAYADAKLLHVVLENLLCNAWKFSSKTPRARIRLGQAVIDGEFAFFVADDGAGFDMHKADGLFTPFQRLHSDEEFHGSGIGLATVRRIIERHGGGIWAESMPGQGATFWFTLKPCTGSCESGGDHVPTMAS